jgi:hypothetical protein
MRSAMARRGSSEKEMITVKTSKGEEFKFGGISDQFTRKLYEWEEQKGIAPESSTIALLNDTNAEEAANRDEIHKVHKIHKFTKSYLRGCLHVQFWVRIGVRFLVRLTAKGGLLLI